MILRSKLYARIETSQPQWNLKSYVQAEPWVRQDLLKRGAQILRNFISSCSMENFLFWSLKTVRKMHFPQHILQKRRQGFPSKSAITFWRKYFPAYGWTIRYLWPSLVAHSCRMRKCLQCSSRNRGIEYDIPFVSFLVSSLLMQCNIWKHSKILLCRIMKQYAKHVAHERATPGLLFLVTKAFTKWKFYKIYVLSVRLSWELSFSFTIPCSNFS